MSDQRCGTCVWYNRPWPGPTHGFCLWLNVHEAKLPEWVFEVSQSRSPTAGEDCKVFKPRMIEVDEAPINWSVRVKWALLKHGYETIARLCEATERELRALPKIGSVSIREIKRKLGDRGLKLRGDTE